MQILCKNFVKTLCFQCWGHGSIPVPGTKIPHAMWHGQKKKKTFWRHSKDVKYWFSLPDLFFECWLVAQSLDWNSVCKANTQLIWVGKNKSEKLIRLAVGARCLEKRWLLVPETTLKDYVSAIHSPWNKVEVVRQASILVIYLGLVAHKISMIM